MKPLDPPKTDTLKKDAPFKEKETERRKKFPKIESIDPDLKKKKKTQEERPLTSIFTPPIHHHIISFDEEIKTAMALIQKIAEQSVKSITFIKNKQRSQTSFLIESKIFGEVEISIKLYSTNPERYHIQLLGNEKIQQAAVNHEGSLISHLKSALPALKVHMSPPALREKQRFKSKKEKKGVEKSSLTWYGA